MFVIFRAKFFNLKDHYLFREEVDARKELFKKKIILSGNWGGVVFLLFVSYYKNVFKIDWLGRVNIFIVILFVRFKIWF